MPFSLLPSIPMGYECTFNCVTGTFMRTTDINSTIMLVQSRRICGSIMGLPEIVGEQFHSTTFGQKLLVL